MSTLYAIDVGLGGLFAFAAIHYALTWWFARNERVLLVFAVMCALYAGFTVTMSFRHIATTVNDGQRVLDWSVTLGMLAHAALLELYACLGKRRDHVFRALLFSVFVFLALWNLWAPLRGTVVELQPLHMPGGGTGMVAIRTPPRVSLAVMYLAAGTLIAYGVVVARTIWTWDRWGASFVGLGLLATVGANVMGLLIDFAHLRAPYVGASPVAFLVLCMSFVLAREYSARAARETVANRQFEMVFEHAPIGMAVLTSTGQVRRVNRALCNIFGVTAELGTQRLQDLIEVESPLLAGELQAYAVEKSFLRNDGERGWALLAVSMIPDDEGRPVRIVAQMQDVTELREHGNRLEELVATRTRELRDAKDEADRANAAKSEFLAQMSHEIRTPLGVITLYAQLLQRDPALAESQRKKIDNISSSGKHLSKLLTDVLETSKLEAGHGVLVEDRFDPWTTLGEVEQMFTVQSASNDVALTLEIDAALPHSLVGDASKVKQIVINLVSNAVKFTRHGLIRIKASARVLTDDEVLVEIVVADSGLGIAAPDLERIFQPFEQLKAGARAGGTGLGLAISLAYARLMHGDLTVKSTPDVGTTFTSTFRAKRVGPSDVAMATTHRKVLIVDDVQQNREVLAELLSQPSFETRTAFDGPGALAIHAEWYPDLVLMDLRMPGMDGLEAIRRMRDAGSKAAIGVLSASALADDETKALAIGADFFMRKPYDERELFERIARVLASR